MNYGKIGKMKYIEELSHGDVFTIDTKTFLLTSDFKKSGDKLAYSMVDGSPKWFSSQAIVEVVPIYTLDSDNNTIPIKIVHHAPNQN